jgi:hypothetical protein
MTMKQLGGRGQLMTEDERLRWEEAVAAARPPTARQWISA